VDEHQAARARSQEAAEPFRDPDSPRKGRAQLGGQDGRSTRLRLAVLALSQTRILPRVFGQYLPVHLMSE